MQGKEGNGASGDPPRWSSSSRWSLPRGSLSATDGLFDEAMLRRIKAGVLPVNAGRGLP